MSGKSGVKGPWCEMTVAIREDILTAAQSADLDIQDLCNRALAEAAGIRYVREPREKKTPSAPVIIADPGILPSGRSDEQEKPGDRLHPVINADDPRARAAVKLLPKQKAITPRAALPGRVTPLEKPLPAPAVPVPVPIPEKPTAKTRKRPKGSPIRQFVAERIAREEGEDYHISKEVLYAAFAQWCRERRITPAPDRRSVTVALKNQFAMTEATIAGEPSWVNARIR